MTRRACRNCGAGLHRSRPTPPWCVDCMRAFLKGVATALGTVVGTYLANKVGGVL